jgi:hypothetical protein
MRIAALAADEFMQKNNTYYEKWVFDSSLVRRYTVFGVFTDSPCKISEGDVVEVRADVRDASDGSAWVMHACFRGDRGSEYPLVYITRS